MRIPANININHLWKTNTFKKEEWGSINFLVGPNGTGKTLFANELRHLCASAELKVRYLNAERLSGLEKENYSSFSGSNLVNGFDLGSLGVYKSNAIQYGLSSDAFVILNDKIDLRIKIEAALAQLFDKKITLVSSGGYLKPMMQKVFGGGQYELKTGECHGLKELISLLTFLYDDGNNCLIIDEPELHLHPQFQALFLQEMRKIAGDPKSNPTKKIFFIITHSPYFVDIRTIEDLKNCIVFQPDKLPTYIKDLNPGDELRIKKFLPRLNTHHKQFFFASRPIFVEGYTDQQLFTIIQEKRGKLLGASGACIIDVGGKDELDLFFRLCKNLNINAQVITDLDTILKGNLRQSVSEDSNCKDFVTKIGGGTDLMQMIGRLEQLVNKCYPKIEELPRNHSLSDTSISTFIDTLKSTQEADIKSKRYVFLVGLQNMPEKIKNLLSANIDELQLAEGVLKNIIDAFKKCNIYVLPNGQLENYLPSYRGNPYNISNKQGCFESEQDYLLDNNLTNEQFKERYKELVNILDETSHSITVNLDSHINDKISDLIHETQKGFHRQEILDKGLLQRKMSSYIRILDISEFTLNKDAKQEIIGFNCKLKLKLKSLIDSCTRQITFDEKSNAANFKLPPP